MRMLIERIQPTLLNHMVSAFLAHAARQRAPMGNGCNLGKLF